MGNKIARTAFIILAEVLAGTVLKDSMPALAFSVVVAAFAVFVTWEGLPDWIARHQTEDAATTLGDIRPPAPQGRQTDSNTNPVIMVEATGGTNAVLVVRNIGRAFTLSVRARIANVAAPYTIDSAAPYEFWRRDIPGGDAISNYTIATVNRGQNFGSWEVRVHEEQNIAIQYWRGHEGIWFDIEWTIQSIQGSEHHTITTLMTRLTLDQQDAMSPRLNVKVLDTSANSGQLSVNFNRSRF